MRTLAIDYGQKRIGLAISDSGAKLATPLQVLEPASQAAAIQAIAQLVQQEDVARIVVGLPLNMDGTTGPAAKVAVDFGRAVAAQTQRIVIFVDERLSSFDAEQSITSRRKGGEKITRKDKKRRLDAIAAAQFLQEFLDGKLQPINL